MNNFFLLRTRLLVVGMLFSFSFPAQLSNVFAKDDGCQNKYVIQKKKDCKNCKQNKGKDCKTPWLHYYTPQLSIQGKFSKWYTAEVQVSSRDCNFEKANTKSPDRSKYSFSVPTGYANSTFSFGMIDTCGSFIVPPVFSSIENLNGLFSLGWVDSITSAGSNKRLFYLINRKNGKYKRLPDMYEYEIFSPNLFLVKSSQLYGILDTIGNIIIKPEYNNITNLTIDNKKYQMDSRNSYKRPYEYSNGWLDSYYGLMYAEYSEDMKRNWYSYCKVYDEIDSVIDKILEKAPLLLLEKDSKMGICDGSGKIITPVENEKITYNSYRIVTDANNKDIKESDLIEIMKDNEHFSFMHSDLSPLAKDTNDLFVSIELQAHKKHEPTAEEKAEYERQQEENRNPLNFAYRVKGMFVVTSVQKDGQKLTSSQFGNNSYLYIDRVNNNEIVVNLSPKGEKYELCHMAVEKVNDDNYQFESSEYTGSWLNVGGHYYVTISSKSKYPEFVYKAQM